MNSEPQGEESIRFGDGGRLSGVLHYPQPGAPRLAVLLCSPHPNFAGDMENNVIQALAGRLANDHVVLRFDYRGIGQSRIELPQGVSVFDFWDKVEQTHEYSPAIDDTTCASDELYRQSGHLPMVAIGYSFGAMTATRLAIEDSRVIAMVGIAPPLQRIDFEFLERCPKPCLMLSGEDDFVYDPEVATNLLARSGERFAFERIAGADHFMRDQEPMLAERVARFVLKSSEDSVNALSSSV